MSNRPLTIFYICTDWWGSDARALGVALRAEGHALIEGIYEDYFPQTWMSTRLRIVRKLIRPWIAAEYNTRLLQILATSRPDLLLVFKGMLLSPEVVKAAKARGIPAYCVYPDVSFANFGRDIVACMELYDTLFTTKRFHLGLPASASLRLPRERILLSHGYDPEVHRPLDIEPAQRGTYGCEASYIGVWTPKKEETLKGLITLLPDLDLSIWGPAWERSDPRVRERWRGRGAFGDEATLIYQASRINLCILTEASGGIPEGDQVTVRTWQIPASGGFLLHEDTDELKRHFTAGSEVGVFHGVANLARQVSYYLSHDAERERTRLAGHERCLRDRQTYRPAAREIVEHFRRQAGSTLVPAPG